MTRRVVVWTVCLFLVAMAAGLSAAGLPAGISVSSVLLYRIATFWIPIPIGWISLTWLQRVGSL